jgi:hypothetical protein
LVGRSAEECSLDKSDVALARFAAKLADRLAVLVESIEARLSRTASRRTRRKRDPEESQKNVGGGYIGVGIRPVASSLITFGSMAG